MIEARQIQRQIPLQALPRVLPMMREYRGIKLGMNRVDVEAAMGRTARAGMDWDEFRLGGSDLMNVRYDEKDAVKTIQLYFTNQAHAPAWAEIGGDAEIRQNSTGSKYARAVNKEENFCVRMFQSKTGAVTTITLSR
jgi:hypothetical protein